MISPQPREDMNLLPCFLSSFIAGGGDVEDSDFPLLISCLFDKSLSFSKCLSSFLWDSIILCIWMKERWMYKTNTVKTNRVRAHLLNISTPTYESSWLLWKCAYHWVCWSMFSLHLPSLSLLSWTDHLWTDKTTQACLFCCFKKWKR